MRGVWSKSRLEFRDDDVPNFDTDEEWDVWLDNCQAQGTPIHPDRFEKTLSDKVFTNGSDK